MTRKYFLRPDLLCQIKMLKYFYIEEKIQNILLLRKVLLSVCLSPEYELKYTLICRWRIMNVYNVYYHFYISTNGAEAQNQQGFSCSLTRSHQLT